MRPSAIRYYEAQGVLMPPMRSATEYRLYGSETVSMIRFIQRARELGFSLEQIRQLVDAARDEPPCIACRQLVEQRLAQVEQELRQLRTLRDRLRRLARQPASTVADVICPLIEGEQIYN